MKKLYFVRHGESQANALEIFAGRMNTPLTALGKEQAKLAGQAAKNLKIDCLISSPLARARQTAEIIAEQIGLPKTAIVFSDLFMERDYGALQGRPWSDAGDIDFDKVAGIETSQALIQRAAKAVEFLQNFKADNLLLVGHGTMGRTIRDLMLKDSAGAIEVPIEKEIPNSIVVQWL